MNYIVGQRLREFHDWTPLLLVPILIVPCDKRWMFPFPCQAMLFRLRAQLHSPWRFGRSNQCPISVATI